jgi:hypothetical protein
VPRPGRVRRRPGHRQRPSDAGHRRGGRDAAAAGRFRALGSRRQLRPFMTANLLAHSDLFRTGIPRSGAGNPGLPPDTKPSLGGGAHPPGPDDMVPPGCRRRTAHHRRSSGRRRTDRRGQRDPARRRPRRWRGRRTGRPREQQATSYGRWDARVEVVPVCGAVGRWDHVAVVLEITDRDIRSATIPPAMPGLPDPGDGTGGLSALSGRVRRSIPASAAGADGRHPGLDVRSPRVHDERSVVRRRGGLPRVRSAE